MLIKSNRTALQTYKGDERTFGTPCILCRKCSGVVYIGETGRRIGDRFREHRLDVIKIKMALPVPAHFGGVEQQLEDMQVTVIRAGLPEQDKRRRKEMRFIHKFGSESKCNIWFVWSVVSLRNTVQPPLQGFPLTGRILGPAASPLCSGSLGLIFLMSRDTLRSIVAPGNSTAEDMMFNVWELRCGGPVSFKILPN